MSVLPELVDALLHMGIEPLGDLSQLGDVGPLDQLRHDVFNAVGGWNDYGPFPLHLLARRVPGFERLGGSTISGSPPLKWIGAPRRGACTT
jgi:hypothetical protein